MRQRTLHPWHHRTIAVVPLGFGFVGRKAQMAGFGTTPIAQNEHKRPHLDDGGSSFMGPANLQGRRGAYAALWSDGWWPQVFAWHLHAIIISILTSLLLIPKTDIDICTQYVRVYLKYVIYICIYKDFCKYAYIYIHITIMHIYVYIQKETLSQKT